PGSIRRVEERAIDGYPEAALLGALQRIEGAVIDARLADRFIVHLGIAIKVNRPVEVAVRRIAVEVLRQKKGIGADGHEFPSRDRALHDLWELLVQQGLAAGDH